MKVRLELVAELDESKWNDNNYELEEFVCRLISPYVKVLKSEARREWYEGEFD